MSQASENQSKDQEKKEDDKDYKGPMYHIHYKDKTKKIASGVISVSCLGLLYFAYAMFGCYNDIAGIVVDGSPFLEEFYIDYVKVESTLFVSIGLTVLSTFLGLLCVLFKRTGTALLFIVIAIWSSLYIHIASHQSGIVSAEIEKVQFNICNLTSKGPELDQQFQRLVHKWMCTEECRCYAGEGGSNKALWAAYGNEILNPFLRNAGDREDYFDQANGDYRVTKPLVWTTSKENSVENFKECYETVLKPQNVYISKEQEMVTKFYDEGGFEFMIWIEGIHHQCASICQPPLFYITKEISEGMPETECVAEQVEESKDLADSAKFNCLMCALILFQAALWAIPLFEPLEVDTGRKCFEKANKDSNAVVDMPKEEEAGFDQKNVDDDRRRSTVDVNKIEMAAVELDQEMIGIQKAELK